MSLEYNKKLIPRAKELRKNMTPQEKHLWYDFLSKYPIRFQRQKTIGSYIVDFYSHKGKLVIEVDGSQHYTEEGLLYDAERTRFLNAQGLTVLRFTNADIMKNFEGVCLNIDEFFRNLHQESSPKRRTPHEPRHRSRHFFPENWRSI